MSTRPNSSTTQTSNKLLIVGALSLLALSAAAFHFLRCHSPKIEKVENEITKSERQTKKSGLSRAHRKAAVRLSKLYAHEDTFVGPVAALSRDSSKLSRKSSTKQKSSSKHDIATTHTSGTDPHRLEKKRCRPLVVCGPAGVGKGTLLARLMEDFPVSFTKCVSHTTRQPRQGEVNGISYHFVGVDEFKQMIEENKFVEWAKVHENFYGTSIAAVEDEANSGGKIVILEIDVQGCETVNKSTSLNPFNIFILPPSSEELKSRMQNRGSESEESMKIRLETAEKELDFHRNNQETFHHSLINDDLDSAYEELKLKIMDFYPHLRDRYPTRIVA